MASVKNPPWAPTALTPLSSGSLTVFAKRGTLSLKRPAKETKTLTASASRITGNPAKDRISRQITGTASRAWQEEVLNAAAQIGELRYIANTTANAASRAWVYPIEDKPEQDSTGGRNGAPTSSTKALQDNAPEAEGAPPGALDAEIVRRCALLLTLIAECYVVELPRGRGRPGADSAPEVHVLAPMDVAFQGDETVRLWGKPSGNAGQVTGGREFPLSGPGSVKLTRIHRPDARNAEEPDCAARSALPVMRELIGLSMHVSATIDSRTASAGIFAYPSDATVTQPGGTEGEFPDVLTEVMSTAIQDRDSASAYTPILLGVPPGSDGSVGDRIKWIMSPGSVLDNNIHTLREDCLRRLALGMDAPPEVILGAKGLSHFGAWSVEGEFIRLQIAPLLKLICDGLSVAFDIDYTFDTGPLTVRPNRAVEAQALYDRGALSESALRAACGFTEDDAPKTSNKEQQAFDLALVAVKDSPSLMQTPGLPAVVDQFRIVLGLKPMHADYYPASEKAPLAGSPNKNDQPVGSDSGATNGRQNPRNGGDGTKPKGNRPVSDGSPEGGADGQPHNVPGTS